MMPYHSLVWFILLMQFFHGVKSKTYNQDFRSQLFQSKAKRAWNYPPVSIIENSKLINTPFVRKKIVTLASSNTSTYTYKLLPGSVGADDGYFTITSSGEVKKRVAEVFQERKVDYEEQTELAIYAEALDSNGNKAEPNDIAIVIVVIDVNDEKPVFLSSTLVGEVPENGKAGSSFFTIRATDADSEANLYGVVRYSIVVNSEQPSPPNGQARFSVDNVGKVTLQSSVDREAISQITFLALAKDGPEEGPGFTTTGTVTVNIVDVNDNAPVFTMNPYPTVSIGELSPVNVKLLVVEATDKDIGLNKAVHFDITLGDSNGHFQIVSELNKDGLYVGTLTIQSPLDFETQSSYQLTILAKNKDANENAETLTSTTAVTIKVIDENEPPVFIGEPYFATVLENDPNGVNNLVKVEAEDYDFNGNQKISYGFVKLEPWFDLSSDGIISTVANKPITREKINIDKDENEYVLLVTATDDYNPIKATATTSVIIGIFVKNEYAPEKNTGWNATLCETPSEEMKQNVTLITVKDKDSSIYSPFEFEILDTDSIFSLKYGSSNSRVVQTNESYFDRKDVDVYKVHIQVSDATFRDQPAQVDILTLIVYICSCNGSFILDCSFNNSPTLISSITKSVLPIFLALLILSFTVWYYKRRSNLKKKKQGTVEKKSVVEYDTQNYYATSENEQHYDDYYYF